MDISTKTFGKLVSLVGKKVGYHNAEDLAQNIMLRAWESFDESKGASFESYCFLVAQGKLLDTMRSKYRRGNLASLDILQASNNPEEPSFEIPAKSARYDILEIAEEVCTEEECFILAKKLEGFDSYEIANMLGVSPGELSKRYTKAVEKLREEM